MAVTSAEQRNDPEPTIIGRAPSEKTAQVIRGSSEPGETPWLIVNTRSNGTLVAFGDRLMIVNVGALTAVNQLTLGSSFATHFFEDISGVQYNRALIGGQLQVLTPAYQGGGIGAGDKAIRLAHSLYMNHSLHKQAVGALNELRDRIASVKKSHGSPAHPQSVSLHEELGRLAELREQGALTDAEFAQAKARLLNQ